MKREFHVRFCERWRGKLPLPTRHLHRNCVTNSILNKDTRIQMAILDCEVLGWSEIYRYIWLMTNNEKVILLVHQGPESERKCLTLPILIST